MTDRRGGEKIISVPVTSWNVCEPSPFVAPHPDARKQSVGRAAERRGCSLSRVASSWSPVVLAHQRAALIASDALVGLPGARPALAPLTPTRSIRPIRVGGYSIRLHLAHDTGGWLTPEGRPHLRAQHSN